MPSRPGSSGRFGTTALSISLSIDHGACRERLPNASRRGYWDRAWPCWRYLLCSDGRVKLLLETVVLLGKMPPLIRHCVTADHWFTLRRSALDSSQLSSPCYST